MVNQTKEVSARLRISSDTLYSNDILSILGCQSDKIIEKGQKLESRGPIARYADETTCFFDSGLPEDSLFEEHLEKISAFVDNYYVELKQLTDNCQITLYISFATYNQQGSLVIAYNMVQKFFDLKIDIFINFFSIED